MQVQAFHTQRAWSLSSQPHSDDSIFSSHEVSPIPQGPSSDTRTSPSEQVRRTALRAVLSCQGATLHLSILSCTPITWWPGAHSCHGPQLPQSASTQGFITEIQRCKDKRWETKGGVKWLKNLYYSCQIPKKSSIPLPLGNKAEYLCILFALSTYETGFSKMYLNVYLHHLSLYPLHMDM